MPPWKVLVVDDEEGIHGITRMIFRGYEFEQRPIELISAMSGAQARELLLQHPDIALALLDVVMETDNEGLQLVEHIRNELNNRDIRVILRTGHPGYAPESQVIVNYDINDYLSKAELSASRLLTSVVVALRSFRDIKSARLQAATVQAPAEQDSQVLRCSAEQLNQQMLPILKQSQRLQQFELNPGAKDLTANLHAQHQRLHNSIVLLAGQEQPLAPQLIALAPMLDEILHVFLPQSRRDGWLLDYSLEPTLPAQINADSHCLKPLLISALELAILQADGNDLKLSVQPAQQASQRDRPQLLFSLQQLDGQPVFSDAPWSKLLQQHIQQLCTRMQGQVLEVDDSGALRYLLPL